MPAMELGSKGLGQDASHGHGVGPEVDEQSPLNHACYDRDFHRAFLKPKTKWIASGTPLVIRSGFAIQKVLALASLR
jgi:hypothetical protein